MGASLGCCGGPSDDYDLSMLKTARYHPMMGRCDDVEKSLLRKLQRSISTSWTTTRQDTRSPHAASLVSSRYALDYESESDTEEPSGIDSNASVTSGSRLLCDFYNLVLECDHSKFFVDANGRRIKGAYLTQIDILEDYFAIARRQLGNSRRRRRSSMDEREALAYQPPHKLKSSSDRSSAMSLLSSDSTSQTLTSESDYWATFMDSAEDNSYFSRQSVERRRSWVLHDMSMYASSLSDTTILFSPVNTDSVPSSSARPRSSSRNSFRSPHHHKPTPSHPVVPIEGHHQHNYNLWTREENQNKPSVPSVFSTAAVNERRRASLSMGSSTTVNGHNASRRMSLQTVAPVAAS